MPESLTRRANAADVSGGCPASFRNDVRLRPEPGPASPRNTRPASIGFRNLGAQYIKAQMATILHLTEASAYRRRVWIWHDLAHPLRVGGCERMLAWCAALFSLNTVLSPEDKADALDTSLRPLKMQKNQFGPVGEKISLVWQDGVYLCAASSVSS
jgi:hypothetical protein